jgi:hypothetical protein
VATRRAVVSRGMSPDATGDDEIREDGRMREAARRLRSWLGNPWIQAILTFLLIGGGGLLFFLVRIQPGASAGHDYSAELAWDQLVAGVLAVVLALIFGRYAVASVREFRRAQHDERVAQDRHLYLAMYSELYTNWLILLALEKRIAMPWIFALRTRQDQQRAVYDAFCAGPIWRSQSFPKVLPTVETAYRELAQLYALLPKDVPLGPIVLLGELACAETAKTWTARSPRAYAWAGLGALGFALLLVIGTKEIVRRSGRMKRARLAVEAAMTCIYREVFGQPVPWDTLRNLPQGFRILPE